ncbi:tetratricopeptide repeat protein [Mesorhizobium sp. ORM8.1]
MKVAMTRDEQTALARKWRWLIRLVLIIIVAVVLQYFRDFFTDPNYTACLDKTLGADRRIETCTQVIEHGAIDRRGAAYEMRGNAWITKRDYDRAMADYDQAVSLHPKNALVFYNRGRAWLLKGDNDRAIADCDQAIALDPKMVDAYNNRGLAWAGKGEDDRAIADYDHATSLDPLRANPFYNLGMARARKGDKDRAMADFSTAITLDLNFGAAYVGRGYIRIDKGDKEGAVADFDNALRIDPKNDEASYGRGIAYFHSGAMAKARVDFERAAILHPDCAYCAIWLDMAERRLTGAGSHLQGRIGKIDMTKWPAPVIRMLLGEKTAAETLAAAADTVDANTMTGQVCEANFYTAEFDHIQGQEDEALRLYRTAVSDCPADFIEAAAAKAALRELGASL